MRDEIRRIMQLVKEGKLSPEDATDLIEAFEEPAASAGTVPVRGSSSFATPIRPVPASPAAEALVMTLRLSATSWPSNLPPSSIARCAAAA